MTRPRKTKTPQGGRAEGAFNTTNSKDIFTYLPEAINRHIWLIGYGLEEARQSNELHRRHFRRLVCCIGLAALRLFAGGLHHV